MARRASAIEKLRTQGHGALVLDAGDALLQNPAAPVGEGDLNKAEAIMRGQAMAGVELMAVGEAEVAVGIDRLTRWARQTSQTLLCANVTRRGRAPFKPHAVIHTGGVKVGVTAVLELQATEKAGLDLLKKARLQVADPIQAAEREVKALRGQGAELVVLLAHVGAQRIRELAQKVKGINLVIGAHAGHMYSLPMHEGTTYYVEPGRRGQMLGHVQLRLGADWTPDTPLVDDSPRHVLYSEARHELDELDSARGKGRPLTKSDPRLHRAVSLVDRLRTTPPPSGVHRIIASLVTLDQTFADNPAIKGLLDASRASWVNKQVRPLPGGSQRVGRAKIKIEQ